jgi:1-acyl-sn-glycerol-3-phosphate acyltransferase
MITILFPILLVIALSVDLIRFATSHARAILSRALVFVWAYLLGEVWAVVALGVVGLVGRRRAVDATYRLQRCWAGWNVMFLRLAFDVRFAVEGAGDIAPAPILVLARHASLIDSLLPAYLITHGEGIRLRYVLKKELLLDPALDIAGSRLPNYFVSREARDGEAELAAIRQLGETMTASEGVVIFPEGTRFSVEKLERQKDRFRNRDSATAGIVASYRHVLPPRPGGTLALLESTECDVVALAHHGLQGFSRITDVWSGTLVGSTISVGLWRIPRTQIPLDRHDRGEWLYEVWSDVDEWISTKVRV